MIGSGRDNNGLRQIAHMIGRYSEVEGVGNQPISYYINFPMFGF